MEKSKSGILMKYADSCLQLQIIPRKKELDVE